MARPSKGRQWGWLGGFLGASCWAPVLAAVLWHRGDMLGAGLVLVGWLGCLAALFWFRPWAHPQVRFWRLYLGALAPVLITAGIMIWRLNPHEHWGRVGWPSLLGVLPVFLIPLLTQGRQTWRQIEEQEMAPGPGEDA